MQPWWRRSWGASGALATVLMAGFIGLLWRGEPPGPAVDGLAPAAVPAAAPAALPSTVPAASPAPLPAAPKPGGAAAVAGAVQVARQPVEAENQARQAKESATAADRESAERTRMMRIAMPEKSAADQAVAVDAAAPIPAPTPPSASPPPPSPAPSPAPSPSPPPAPATAALPAPATGASPAAAVPTPARPAAAMRAEASRPALAAHLSARLAPPGLPDWQPGDQIAWEPASTAALPSASWLRQLASLTQTAWSRAAGAPPSGPRLLWQRQGAALGMLQMESGVVWWCAAGQACIRADVPPDALRDLVGKLPSER